MWVRIIWVLYESLKGDIDGTNEFVRSKWFFNLQEFELYEFYCIQISGPGVATVFLFDCVG